MAVSTGMRIVILGGLAIAVVLVCRWHCREGRKRPPRFEPGWASPKKSIIENFREPILPNYEKMVCDNQPRSNGSIYGECSHLMSGYPYYDKAY